MLMLFIFREILSNTSALKHIELDIHFVREKVARGQARVLHVPSRFNLADICTKGLPRVLFDEFRSNLSVQSPPTSIDGV